MASLGLVDLSLKALEARVDSMIPRVKRLNKRQRTPSPPQKRSRRVEIPEHTVIVYHRKGDELHKSRLKEFFSKFGRVVFTHTYIDRGRNKQYALIGFEDPEAKHSVIEKRGDIGRDHGLVCNEYHHTKNR